MIRTTSRAIVGAALTVLLGSFAVAPATADPVEPAPVVVTMNTALVDGKAYPYGSVEVTTAPTCTAVQDVTPVACEVAGYGTTVGTWTLVPMVGAPAVAATPTITYTVTKTWTVKGFLSPVKKNGTLTRHYGSNTPLKFTIKEHRKSKAKTAISTFVAVPVSCTSDHTPVVGGTTVNLYPSTRKTGNTFHVNWKTSKIKPVKVTVPAKGKHATKKIVVSSCYQVTMTAVDGQSIVALVTFKK